jgi:hypothetical protein
VVVVFAAATRTSHSEAAFQLGQPSLFVAPNGSDSGVCTAGAPCASFAHAYKVARPGEIVAVASGDYPYQQLPYDQAKSADAHVVFQPATGAVVNVAQIDFGQAQSGVRAAQHVTLRNLRVGYLRAWPGTKDVIWQNIRGRTFDIFSGDHVSVFGGDFGPCEAPRDVACTSRLIGTNLVVDGASIHGVTSTDLQNYHVDGMFIRGCQGCVVRRSRFWSNMITNIRIQNQPNNANASLTLENNWFAPSLQGDGVSLRADAIDVDDPVPDLMIRNNSFAPGSAPQLIGTYSSASVVGNLFTNIGCASGVFYAYNLYVRFSGGSGNAPCSGTDRRVTSLGYADSSAFDLHLVPGSPAFGYEPRSLCPRVDIDGERRPTRLERCDAGADQRGIAMCHRGGKRKSRSTTVEVDPSRVTAHKARGDRAGACPGAAIRR